MAEKRVSVRLSATGGRQVRAELEGVGEAGTRGMGRLNREMDQANARMAAFARRARIAASAAATALAGAVVVMTRSTVAAANEIGQLSQVANAGPELFQRWSAASATVGIEQEGTDLLFTPPIAGSFSYQCANHAAMGGDITVNA